MGRLRIFGWILSGTRLNLGIPDKGIPDKEIPDKGRPGIAILLNLLLVTLVACHGGCKQCSEVTSDFACALDACSLDDCLQATPDDCCGTAAPTESGSCEKKPCETTAARSHCLKKCSIWSLFKTKAKAKAKSPKQRAEPVITYEPPRPPKFLLVPSQEVFSRVNMMAPIPRRGDVEVGFGPLIDIPGHD